MGLLGITIEWKEAGAGGGDEVAGTVTGWTEPVFVVPRGYVPEGLRRPPSCEWFGSRL
jgi:hypothetical protein